MAQEIVPQIVKLPPSKKNMPVCFYRELAGERVGLTAKQGLRYVAKEIQRFRRKHKESSEPRHQAAMEAAQMVLKEIAALGGSEVPQTKADGYALADALESTLKADPMDLNRAFLTARAQLGFTGELNPQADEDQMVDDELNALLDNEESDEE